MRVGAAQGPHRRADDPADEPPPAGVGGRDAGLVAAPEQHRQAVGREHHQPEPRPPRRQGVALRPPAQVAREQARPRRGVEHPHPGAVDLAAEADPPRRPGRRRRTPLPVRAHRGVRVAPVRAEVQRRERPLADAAAPGAEDGAGGRVRRDLDQLRPGHRPSRATRRARASCSSGPPRGRRAARRGPRPGPARSRAPGGPPRAPGRRRGRPARGRGRRPTTGRPPRPRAPAPRRPWPAGRRAAAGRPPTAGAPAGDARRGRRPRAPRRRGSGPIRAPRPRRGSRGRAPPPGAGAMPGARGARPGQGVVDGREAVSHAGVAGAGQPRDPQAAEQREGARGRGLPCQPHQLVGHARAPRVEARGGLAGRGGRVAGEQEPQAGRVPRRAHQPAGVLLEGVGPQRPHDAGLRVGDPPCGSTRAPAPWPESRRATALIVKSRRARSSASVPGVTSGSAPGRE